ncbi:hypothetical protein EDC39_11179 [Geothermobacter ehrlichii]|uniref:Uncharacterized protein n=1 Tax=Geothermobacter ehrlichii TaxID=213224 RepID=A0A5D3WIX6_9BACT|nr:hypothetical protein [Geothermobacter ehrlichii]TYO97149.1 hypothetical protein EDC39_11179 [Geothermobacter ehrlichii]
MSAERRHPTERYCPRFGQLAVKMGFVTPEQLKQALSEQVDDNLGERPHRILGTIFFEHGWMTPKQIEEVLNVMFDQLKKEEGL